MKRATENEFPNFYPNKTVEGGEKKREQEEKMAKNLLNSINSVGGSALRSYSLLQMSMHMQSALRTRTSVSPSSLTQ